MTATRKITNTIVKFRKRHGLLFNTPNDRSEIQTYIPTLHPPPPSFRKMRPHLPIHTPVQSLKSRKSQNMWGNEANRPNTLAKKQKMTSTGLRPILSDNSPPTIAPTSHPPKTREVERELRIALSQTRSN